MAKEIAFFRLATIHNLHHLTVEIPLGGLVAITGVSGAGKSTLMRDVLVPGLDPRGSLDPTRRAWRAIEGAERIDSVILVDQAPVTRSSRSTPATITKAFDGSRQLFAATRHANAPGRSARRFSFTLAGGPCA